MQTVPKILLVDDDPSIHVIAKAMLGPKYQIVSAFDGQDAITKLQDDEDFNLVILDVFMPKMDGYGLVDFLRKKSTIYHEIPVLMISEHPEEENSLQAKSLSADAWLGKPLDKDVLQIVVDNLLN